MNRIQYKYLQNIWKFKIFEISRKEPFFCLKRELIVQKSQVPALLRISVKDRLQNHLGLWLIIFTKKIGQKKTCNVVTISAKYLLIMKARGKYGYYPYNQKSKTSLWYPCISIMQKYRILKPQSTHRHFSFNLNQVS